MKATILVGSLPFGAGWFSAPVHGKYEDTAHGPLHKFKAWSQYNLAMSCAQGQDVAMHESLAAAWFG